MGPSTFPSQSRLLNWLTFLPLLVILVLWGRCTLAASMTDRLAGSADVPWEISADKVAYEAASTTYHARGNVVIEKQATRLTADHVAFNHQAMTAMASGHVVMTAGNDILTGDRVELDLKQETGVVYNGSVFLHESHFYIRGDRIEKTGKDTYEAEQAAITSCDGDRPDWSITCRSLKVKVEGYGSGTHARLKARNVPVLYTPYIVFPAKTKRQTGLLLPDFTISDRKGYAWDQPLFWAINDNTDATLYTRYMSERGTKVGLEYRYALTENSFGAIMADGLHDRQIDDGTPESTARWGYVGRGDRTNRDRWWVRTKVNQALPWKARAKLDLDIVSDQDYLTEFREGYSDFYNTRDYFRETFSRDIDTYDDSTRKNQLNVQRAWSLYTLNGDLLWFDDVIKRRLDETDPTLQRLPLIQFNGIKHQIRGSGVFWDLNSRYAYFFRQDGDRGHRMDIYPRAYYPIQWGNYLSLEPSAGWRQTAWAMDRWTDESIDQYNYRQIFDAQLDLSTNFDRVFDSPLEAFDRIRHLVKPMVTYRYIVDQDQSDLPEFTDTDRIEGANLITYSLTNTFTARTPKRPKTPASADPPLVDAFRYRGSGSDPGGPSDIDDIGRIGVNQRAPETLETYNYQRFCRFFLEQSYDLNQEDDDARAFSDIFAELNVKYSRYLWFDWLARFDPYDTQFRNYNLSAVITDHRSDQLRLGHSYQKDVKESIRGSLSVKVTDRLKVIGEYERNLVANEDILKGIGFLYTSQCWSFEFFHAREGLNERYEFQINLLGLGGFGQ
jgi:LPS-assembly protein